MNIRNKDSQWKSGFLLLVLLFVSLQATMAEYPLTNGSNPDFQTIIFDQNVNFRQDVCELHKRYANGTKHLADALNGLTISTVFECPTKYCNLKGDDLDPDDPGIIVVLLDELAERAGFNWRNSYALVDRDQRGNKTFDELLYWSTENYDLAVSWWTRTTARIREGVDFPEGWYDADIIMVAGRSDEDQSKFQFGTFLEPFTLGLWMLILGTIVASGLIYYLLELLDHRSDVRKIEKDPVESILIAGIAFTTHFEYQPRTRAAWMFTVSLSFWAMITSAAYTANLASFFVVKNTPGLQIESMQDAVDYRLPICVWKDTGTDTILRRRFKKYNFIRKDKDLLQGVLNGECRIAAIDRGSWDTQRQDPAIGCALEWIGRKYKEIPAGFATRHDSGIKCSSLISEVVNIHFMEMLDNGFVQEAWENHLKKVPVKQSEQTCSLETNSEEFDAESQKLDSKSMGGIFILHFAISFMVVSFTIFAKYTGRFKKRDEILSKLEKERHKEEMMEKNELGKMTKKEMFGKNLTRKTYDEDSETRQAYTSSQITMGCFDREKFPGSLASDINAGCNNDDEMVDNPPFSPVHEAIYDLRSEMQKNQQAHTEEIKDMREEVASILKILNQQQ